MGMVPGRRRDETSFANRTVLVTGGAQGIGWAVATALAERGADVFVCDVSDQNLARAADRLADEPYRDSLRLTELDVTASDQLAGWIADVHDRTGRIDVLVNNAAFARWRDFEEMTPDECDRTMRTGYDATVVAVRTVLPFMRSAGHGQIVNIGSSAGRVFVAGPAAAYSAAKAAVEAFTEVVRAELAGTAIHLLLVRPGVVAGTDFFRRHVDSTRLPRFADLTPCATPADVAAAILRGLRTGRPSVDIPGYLPILYRLYALSPRLVRRLIAVGGPARRDYGRVMDQPTH